MATSMVDAIQCGQVIHNRSRIMMVEYNFGGEMLKQAK